MTDQAAGSLGLSGSWVLGFSWDLGPSHHTVWATQQQLESLQVDWKAGSPRGRAAHTATCLTCGGDVFNGGVVCFPPERDPPWKAVDNGKKSLDYPTTGYWATDTRPTD